MIQIRRETYMPRSILCILCLYNMLAPSGTWTFLLTYQKQRGYQYICLMIDSFSQWCECVSLQSQDTAHVAKVLYNELFCRYGLPSSILSDRGQNCMSKLTSSLSTLFEVTRIRTSSIHPQTYGVCE